MLSPFLYALYTNSCRSTYTGCHCFKYADDTALVGLITNDEGLICWWGNLSVKNRAKLRKLHTISCKIVGCSTPDSSLQKLYNMRTIKMAKKIISDPTHFLHAKYDLLPSGRRHRMPVVRTQRAMKSFIPSSIKLLNH